MKKLTKRRWFLILIIIVSILIITAAGLSYYFGKLVTEGLFYQTEGTDTKNNSILQLELWGYDLDHFNTAYSGTDFTVDAADGNTVPATYFSTDSIREKNTVILIHGLGGDRVSAAPLAEIYLQSNWNVITFDLRGHGDNENPLVTFGYLERIDVEALVEYARELAGNKQVVIHGQSMGGAVAGMYAITDHAAEYIDTVIMDSPVHSMKDMFAMVWENSEDSDFLPLSYMLACGNVYMKLNYGFTFQDVEITAEQRYNDLKTLVIVSTQDEVCLPEYVTALYENISSSEKKLVEFDTAHIMGMIDHTLEYEAAVMNFLND